MTKAVEFYFDFASPTAYLAHTQLPAICDACDASLNYHPALLGGIFKAAANSSPIMVPAKGGYMMSDLARYAKRYDVTLNINTNFPFNSLALMRCAAGIKITQPERLAEYIALMYQAIWVDNLNVNDEASVATLLNENGFDGAAVLALSQDVKVKEALKSTTEDVDSKGAFGLPSMFVDDELYFGQDRLDFVKEALLA